MKIAHLINSLATGGAEKLVVETVPLYQQAGITTDVIVANGTIHPFTQQLQASSNTTIIALGWGSVYNPLLIFKLMRLLNNYDILHVHLFPVQYFAVAAKWLSRSKVKLVFTEHSTSNRRISNKLFVPIENYIYQSYHKVICITDEIKTIYSAYLPKLKNLQVIKNGVNTTKIKNATKYNAFDVISSITDLDKIVIQVSSFQEPKDQATLIKAIQLLPPHFKLILVGEGVEKEKCQQLVQQLKLSERVFFLGIRMDVPQLLKTADIVVLSSKYEGLSLSSIEGMASGKPFIASNVPGLSDVVSGAGLLFECGNEKALATHIQTLTNNPDYYQKTATACQQRAEEFTIEKMVSAHIEMYKIITNNQIER
jgi:glycosyltransferase involved in cell wall biosynthesis